MFKPSYGYFRGAVAIILGLALIIWPNNTPETIMMAMGVVLALLGAISIISSLVKRKKDKSANVDVPIINGIIVTVIGVIVAVWPGDFLKYAFILLGILLAVQAINMIVMLVRARKYSPVGWPFFISPILTLAAGCIILFYPIKTQSVLFIIFGISLLIYGVAELMTTIEVCNAMKGADVVEEKAEVVEDGEPSENIPNPDSDEEETAE
ncbi:MAG: DUF308 domain-containing protein [Bacteroidales bacterium]|nr:DUF308 domain-containing protein [Bacteroidales bacterium]